MEKQKVIISLGMNLNLDPFNYTLAFGLIGSVVSLVPEMNEALRFLILLATFAGIVIKTWEHVKNSTHFKEDMKMLWKKIRKKD